LEGAKNLFVVFAWRSVVREQRNYKLTRLEDEVLTRRVGQQIEVSVSSLMPLGSIEQTELILKERLNEGMGWLRKFKLVVVIRRRYWRGMDTEDHFARSAFGVSVDCGVDNLFHNGG